MTEPHVYKLDLKSLREPDDLWNKLFLTSLKNLSEQHAMNVKRFSTLEKAITQLDKTVSELLPEKPDELRVAMKAMKEVEKAWEQQLTRSVDSTERIAVILKQIIASQKNE